MATEHKDLPKDEIIKMAEGVIERGGGADTVEVHFKYTCQFCGERNTFTEANTIYDNGECVSCGRVSRDIPRYGFSVLFKL